MSITLMGYSQCSDPEIFDDPHSQDGILSAMNIPCAWNITEGSTDNIIGTIDNYFDENHDDFNYIDENGQPQSIVIEILNPSGCQPNQQSYTHGNQSFGAAAGIRDNGICIAGSGGINARVMGLCGGSPEMSEIGQLISEGANIISISWSGIIGASSPTGRTQLAEWMSEGVSILVAGLNQGHQASIPDGYHSIPGIIHVG